MCITACYLNEIVIEEAFTEEKHIFTIKLSNIIVHWSGEIINL